MRGPCQDEGIPGLGCSWGFRAPDRVFRGPVRYVDRVARGPMIPTLALLRTLLALRDPALLATVVGPEGLLRPRRGAMALGTEERHGQEAPDPGWPDLEPWKALVLPEGPPLRIRAPLVPGSEAFLDLLLEGVHPGIRPPWIPFTEQLLGKGREVALVTVIAVDGDVPCGLGDRFAYDDHLHGLQPGDRDLNVRFGRAVEAARAEGCTRTVPVEMVRGTLELLVDPLGEAGP